MPSHEQLQVPEMRALIAHVRRLAFAGTYARRLAMIGENLSHMLSQSTYTLRRLLTPIKKKLEKAKRLDDTRLDQIHPTTHMKNRIVAVTPSAP